MPGGRSGARKWRAAHTRYTLYNRYTAWDYRHVHTVGPTDDMPEGRSRAEFAAMVSPLLRALEDPEGRGADWRMVGGRPAL